MVHSHQTTCYAFGNADQSAVSTRCCLGTLLTDVQLLVHQTPTFLSWKGLLSLSVPSLNMGLFSPTCKTLDLPWWNSWGCCQPIPLACQGAPEGQPSPLVYKHNNLTWLSLGKWVTSKAFQFAVPTTSLKEKVVSFGDLARWSLGLCPLPLGSTVFGVALMFPSAHSAFAFLYFLSSSWIVTVTYWIPSWYSLLD